MILLENLAVEIPAVLKCWAEVASTARLTRAKALMAGLPCAEHARNDERCREQDRQLGYYLAALRESEGRRAEGAL